MDCLYDVMGIPAVPAVMAVRCCISFSTWMQSKTDLKNYRPHLTWSYLQYQKTIQNI